MTSFAKPKLAPFKVNSSWLTMVKYWIIIRIRQAYISRPQMLQPDYRCTQVAYNRLMLLLIKLTLARPTNQHQSRRRRQLKNAQGKSLVMIKNLLVSDHAWLRIPTRKEHSKMRVNHFLKCTCLIRIPEDKAFTAE